MARLLLAALLPVLVLATAQAPAASVILDNLAYQATGAGLLPIIALDQGAAAGIYDGSLFAWAGGVTSPRSLAASSLQPYLTWTAPRTVGSVRVYGDTSNLGNAYDRLRIETLIGADPPQEANWVTRYDSGPGLNSRILDVLLPGGPYTTRGLRIRADMTHADINVGEVAAFAPLEQTGGTLSSRRVVATGASASSSVFRPAPGAINLDTYDGGWLSDTAANNPGDTFTWTATYNSATVNALGMFWYPQGGWAAMPANWTVLIDCGAGYFNAGTYSPSGTQLQQYLALPHTYQNVQAIQIRILEGDVGAPGRVSFSELEAYHIVPEPGLAGLWLGGLAALLPRRRAADRR